MAISVEGNVRPLKTKNMESKRKRKKTEEKREFLVKQEFKFAKALAANDKRIRDRAVKKLKKWLKRRSAIVPFTEEDYMRLWKGLFYTMWMSDKPLVQEECAENIAELTLVQDTLPSLLFFKCGILTLMNEWYGIDQLRLDKFLMFTRRLLRKGFEVLKKGEWKKKVNVEFCRVLKESILDVSVKPPLGLLLHFIDIYLQELAKISDGTPNELAFLCFLEPFISLLATTDDYRISDHIVKYVFQYLIRQSDEGLEYEEKFAAWKQMGFVGGSINSIVKEVAEDNDSEEYFSDDESNNEQTGESVLDPRAGNVNVVLPQIKFRAKDVVEMLNKQKFSPETCTKGQKAITRLTVDFNKFSKGKYPLGIKKVKIPTYKSTNVKKAAKKLLDFEDELMGVKKTKKKRKKRTKMQENDGERPNKKQKVEPQPPESPTSPTTTVPLKKKKKKSESRQIKIKNKSRESVLVQNPFAASNNNSATKSVKINMKLNTSQEFHEHHAKVMSSPVIPFDANKKPLKPLLKPSPVMAPINPFYKNYSRFVGRISGK